MDAIVGNFAQRTEGEDLKAAGVSEEGARPTHEFVQTAHAADGFVAGAEIEVVGVGEEDFDAEVVGEVALVESFDGGLGANGHEDRGLDDTVRGVEEAGAGARGGALGDDFKSYLGHGGEW